jgi:DNA-binding LacI/PurR family transcriptional regulator
VIAFRLRADDHEGAVDAQRRHQATYRVSRERLKGFAAGLEGAVAWDDVPMYETFPNSRAAGARAARALLALEPPPTALLAMSDELAFGALDAARELGLAVPEQLSLLGYDDVPAAGLAGPPLTTVRQPLGEKGRTAGRMLLEALDGGAPADVTLPTELVVRGSTAAPVTR